LGGYSQKTLGAIVTKIKEKGGKSKNTRDGGEHSRRECHQTGEKKTSTR